MVALGERALILIPLLGISFLFLLLAYLARKINPLLTLFTGLFLLTGSLLIGLIVIYGGVAFVYMIGDLK